jgi:hypothetical protein
VENLSAYGLRYNLVQIHPNNESYAATLDSISKFKKKSLVLFLGHGQSDQLYGGESENFPKKSIVRATEMNIFQEQYLFLLACNSASLVERSFRMSNACKSLGFGALPTSIAEIESDRKLSGEGISEHSIEMFKEAIVQVVAEAIIRSNSDLSRILDYLKLLIDKKISGVVITDKDRNLADLLFRMRYEMVLY